MKPRPHPAFNKQLNSFFWRTFPVLAVLGTCAFYFHNGGNEALGQLFAKGFGIWGFVMLGYAYYRLYHVRCPECGGKTQTTSDAGQISWVARCDACDITWKLDIRIEIV